MEEKNFHHPHKPYAIQNELMKAIYTCIDESKIGIFESPTGTGKSLSLICSSLTWLREHKRREFEAQINDIDIDADEPEWIREHAVQEKREIALRRRHELEERLKKIREKERKLRERHTNGEPQAKRRRVAATKDEESLEDDQFLLADYESDGENGSKRQHVDENTGLSAETLALMSKLGYGDLDQTREDDSAAIDETKVFFCSRTHSQLSQFAGELQRVKMPSGLPPLEGPDVTSQTPDNDSGVDLVEDFKHLTLGSRKNLCINPKVTKLGGATAINERCLELQQSNTPTDCKCPYVPTRETETIVNDFRDHALAKIRDIEDLGKLGKQLGICPYYASRPAIKPSEIVTLPYPLLLQKTSRDALDLSLKGHVVIIDEAHNLIDTITGIHSTSVSLDQLERSRSQVMTYLQKFRNKLKGKNRVYVAQVVRLIDSLISALKTASSTSGQKEANIQMSQMMAGKGVDQINLYKLNQYLLESKLARKVDGYITHDTEQHKAKAPKSAAQQSNPNDISAPALMHVQNFLLSLMSPSSEGQFFFAAEDGHLWLKYLLLNPTHHFKEVVSEARSIILAGGTMSPMSDFTDYLFSYLPPSQIMTLSCGHVIPPSNLLAIPVVQSISGTTFDFTFEKRNNESLIVDLGLTIHNLIQSIPDGVVVFFPSYAYLDKCISVWQTPLSKPLPGIPAAQKTLWAAINAAKPIFTEPRSNTQPPPTASNPSSSTVSATTPSAPPAAPAPTTIDSLLTFYSHAITSPPTPHAGALLLAVTSGRLSEGINFSDALGRAVLIVGLPFANPSSPSLAAKLAYISSKAEASYLAEHTRTQTQNARLSSSTSSGLTTTSPNTATATAPIPPAVRLRAKEAGQKAKTSYYENSTMRAVNQSIGRAIRHQNDYAAILMLDRRFGTERIGSKLPGWIRGSLKGGVGARDVGGELSEFFRGRV